MATSVLARNTTSPIIILISIVLLIFSPQSINGDTQLLEPLRDTLSIHRTDASNSQWFDPQMNPCNWTGVKCNGSTVIQIDLSCSFSHQSIPFPKIIAQFKSLKQLNISSCAFTGEILPEFWDLRDLEVLDMSYNSLSGILSPRIANFKRLRKLVLDYNSFDGALPSSIGNLMEIRELSLSSNSFYGDLPEELGSLRQMYSLDISNNLFTGNLPAALGNATSLVFLSVRSNRFTGSICPDIGRLIALRILDLSFNSFMGSISSVIRDMKDLQILHLECCQFTGTFPEELTMLSNLTHLNVARNNFDGELPSSIGRMANLVYLVAPNAGFKGLIPSQLGKLTKLTLIDLSFNWFHGPLPDNLAALESIGSVILHSNSLSGPIPPWISRWKRVISIVLAGNLFSGSLPPLNLPSLTFLDISANKLSGELPEDICSKAPSLIVLTLSHNNISGHIDNVFKNCLHLTDMILSENNISGELPSYLGDLNLVSLELSRNKLSGRIPDHLWESKTLKAISLNGNLFEGPLSYAIGHTKKLTRLLMDNNLFGGSIPTSIGKLANLTNLSLSGNNLTGNIPLELFNCTSLVSLDLGANKLTGRIPISLLKLTLLDNLVLSNNLFVGPIPEEICTGFRKVPIPDSEFMQHYGMLDLSYNQLEGPIPPTISHCTVVQEILLQGNKLNGSVPEEISLLANLTLLDLSYNSFTGVVAPPLFSMNNLQGLVLSHNQLQGSIPDNVWSESSSLAKINLSFNNLRGTLPPSLFGVRSLVYLDVSMNTLSGPLRIEFQTMSSLLVLNASNNQLSGTLDDSLSSLVSLSTLDLHDNKFLGSLPTSMANLTTLTYLDLSRNAFRNSFPCNICMIHGLTYSNFSGNDFSGHSLQSCEDVHACKNGAQVQSRTHDTPSTQMLSRALVFGITIGIAAILAVLFAAFMRWRTQKQSGIHLYDAEDKHSATLENKSSDGVLWQKKIKEPLSINIATFEHSLLRLKAEDILSATENFSDKYIIGDGGFGSVYRASLLDGRVVAVKRLHGGHLHGKREFSAEMETIGKVQHENLVPLLGYCVFDDEMILIYKFMENGSLEYWLRNSNQDALPKLDWPTRFKVCLGSAHGLAFLHHGVVPHIIHRDIKPSNILLDMNFEPCVSDFGLARMISAYESHVSTMLAGTFGYIPPEYSQAMVATTKGDVYSFGVVMLELVTGRAPIGQADVEGGNLVGWVKWMCGSGREDKVLHPSLSGSSARRYQMLAVLSIARACTNDEPGMRPTMLEVVGLLKNVKKMA